MSGQALKVQGQNATAASNSSWMADVLQLLNFWAKGCKACGVTEFVFEDFRAALTNVGIAPPKSHKAWGAVPRVAVKAGLIAPTDKYRPATSPKTHAHPVRVWQFV